MTTQTVKYRYGGRNGPAFTLQDTDDYLVVRSQRPNLDFARLTPKSRQALDGWAPVMTYPEAGVTILQCRKTRGGKASRDAARRSLKRDSDVRFAGRVLVDRRGGQPVLYTENLFVKFDDDTSSRACRRALKEAGLDIKRELAFARNAYFVGGEVGCGRKVFRMPGALFRNERVELCHPELIRWRSSKAAAPQQWHLQSTVVSGNPINEHANVVSAWALSEGAGTTIAIIDDGVDVAHDEFQGAGKIVAPYDATRGVDDGRPVGGNDNHGTACAGVACANGHHGASGVAPRSRLMPIRLMSGLGSIAEAEAFHHAAQNGADVISCSWGPTDGTWWDPNDPLHARVVPLPDSTRLAIDWAVDNGRNGLGCVIAWAAGNGNESVDNDGYASYDRVMAVAACSDRGRRSVYSDMGGAIWCAFPSSDFTSPELTPGIWTTDRSGAQGYNPGIPTPNGDDDGHYAQDFGGTSSACPGTAGVAALVIARNPQLRWDEVHAVIAESCDKIDVADGNYDVDGHSASYGFGRVNARAAVDLALPPTPDYVAYHEARSEVDIRDQATSRLKVSVGDDKVIQSIAVHVDIEHTWIGDLVIKVRPPTGSGAPTVTLHDREGGSAQNLIRGFDSASTPALDDYLGQKLPGVWTLEVRDHADRDQGRIRRFGLEIEV